MIVGWAFERYSFRWAWPLLPLGFVVLLATFPGPALLIAGVPAICIVVGGLALEHRTKELALPKLLGDASYSIYLFHIPVIQMLYTVFRRVPIHGWFQFVAFILAALIVSAAVGITLFRCVEKPLTRELNRRTARRRAAYV